MRMLKNVLAGFVAAAMVATMAGCGSSNSSTKDSGSDKAAAEATTEAAAPEGCRKVKGLFPQPRKIKTFGKNFSKKQFTGQEPCAILFEVIKASIQKPETPTTS